MTDGPWPTELRVVAARDTLKVTFDDGSSNNLSAEFLRVFTPSAERTGHGNRMVIGGKRNVLIKDIRPVGRYAVRIAFDDGHDTGLYTFGELHRFGANREALWQDYTRELEATDLSRDRPGTAPAPN